MLDLSFDAKEFLKKASMAYGVSGFEAMNIAQVVEDSMAPFVDEVRKDVMGNVIGLRRGEGDEPHPKIMLAGHMDEVGLIVTKVEEQGFLRFIGIGVDARILVGHEVIVYGKRPVPGVIGHEPSAGGFRFAAGPEKAKTMEDLFIDTGLPEDEVRDVVPVGSPVTYRRQVTELMGGCLSGKSMDDRAAVASILVCLDELEKYKVKADVYAVATIQEELGMKGAVVSTYGIEPDLGIALDVCHGATPGVPAYRTATLGKGPSVASGGNIHPKIYAALRKAAGELGISVQPELAPGATGTDAAAIQVSREGVPAGLIGIPLRYMHTSVETLAISDVEKAGRLLAKFIASCDASFVKELRIWD